MQDINELKWAASCKMVWGHIEHVTTWNWETYYVESVVKAGLQ